MTILFAPWARPLRNGLRSPKNYPYSKELVERLQAQGHKVTQVGVTGEEQVCDIFLRDLSYEKVLQLLRETDTFIAVDSFLQHAAWAVGKRGIVLFAQSDPLIFGHDLHINLLKSRDYLRPDQFNTYEGLECKDHAFSDPSEVLEALKLL